MMNEDILSKVLGKQPISDHDAGTIIFDIATGDAEGSQIDQFREALLAEDAPRENVIAIIKALRESCERITPSGIDAADIIDVVGSGGGESSFNNMVAAAIIAAAGGAKIAKGVLRAIPGKGGSEVLLKSLGFTMADSVEHANAQIEKIGITFIDTYDFCPALDMLFPASLDAEAHKAFRSIGGIFVNPAMPTRGLYGLADPSKFELFTAVALACGINKGMLVCGEDGYDEISMVGTTHINEIANGRPTSYDTTPEENAIEKCQPSEVNTKLPREAAFAIKSVLDGKLKGTRREAIVLNGAAALMSAGKAGYFARGLLDARNIIDWGKASDKFEEIKNFKF